MLVKDNSPLRRIPTILEREQVLFLHGIRYSISMADYAYVRLYETINRITKNFIAGQGLGQRVSNDDAEINTAMIDAWSIIDSIHRLRELLSGMPKLKQNAAELKLFQKNTENCVILRNTIQHLRHENKKLAQENHPVWGTITWLALESPQAEIFRYFIIYAGSVYNNFVTPPFQPFAKPTAIPIDHISLNAYGTLISLTDYYENLEKLVMFLEALLMRNFREQLGQNTSTDAADLILAVEFR